MNLLGLFWFPFALWDILIIYCDLGSWKPRDFDVTYVKNVISLLLGQFGDVYVKLNHYQKNFIFSGTWYICRNQLSPIERL